MRTSGVTDVVVGPHPHDHLCRPFAEFLADGLRLGQRACNVTHRDDIAPHGENDSVSRQLLECA